MENSGRWALREMDRGSKDQRKTEKPDKRWTENGDLELSLRDLKDEGEHVSLGTWINRNAEREKKKRKIRRNNMEANVALKRKKYKGEREMKGKKTEYTFT